MVNRHTAIMFSWYWDHCAKSCHHISSSDTDVHILPLCQQLKPTTIQHLLTVTSLIAQLWRPHQPSTIVYSLSINTTITVSQSHFCASWELYYRVVDALTDVSPLQYYHYSNNQIRVSLGDCQALYITYLMCERLQSFRLLSHTIIIIFPRGYIKIDSAADVQSMFSCSVIV